MSLHDELTDMAHEAGDDKEAKGYLKAAGALVAGGVIMSLVYYGAIIFGIAVAVRWVLS